MSDISSIFDQWADEYDEELGTPDIGGIDTVFLANGLVNTRMDMFIDGKWVDITHYVRGDKNIVSISRGKANEAAQISPSKMTFKLNNPNGLFCTRNPRSIYFGKLGRNTPVMFSIAGNIRFFGYVSKFPTAWDNTGRDIWCSMEASGSRQQLSQGRKPLKSALRRAILADGTIAAWPLNEGTTSTAFANLLPGGPSMTITSGTPVIGSVDGPIGGDGKAITIRAADAYNCTLAAVPPVANTGTWAIECWVRATGPTSGQGATFLAWTTTGTTSRWEMRTIATATTSGIEIWRDDDAGSYFLALASSAYTTTRNLFDGNWHYAKVTAQQIGSDTFISLQYDDFTAITHTDAGFTTGYIASVVRNSTIGWLITIATTTIDIAQVAVFSADVPDHYPAGIGYAGETTHARLERLCAEQGVPLLLSGDPDIRHLLGAQTQDTFLNLCNASATAGQGLLYEPRNTPGMGYRSRDTLYNQTGPTFDYSLGHLSGELVPTEDDQLLRNDVTITRTRGSEGRFVKTTGINNVNDPQADPDGVGLADEQPTAIIAYDDTWLAHIAAWRVHQGTWPEPRYPAVTVELHRAVYRADSALTTAVIGLDVGGYASIINPPIWLPPEAIELTVESYTEQITNFTWKLNFNCSPGGVWRVGVYDSPDSRREAGSDGYPARLVSGVDSMATALSVAFTTGHRYVRPADDAASFPFYIMIDGESMRVTDVSGTTSPQAMTVDRGINGITKSHDTNAVVQLYRQARYAL